MSFRNWFLVGARLMGLWMAYQACVAAADFLAAQVVMNNSGLFPGGFRLATLADSPFRYFLLVCFDLILAFWLIFGIRPFADYLFRKEMDEERRLQAESSLLDDEEEEFLDEGSHLEHEKKVQTPED